MSGTNVNPGAWEGKCVHSESTLHQLSPYLGKMKSSMAEELILSYTEPRDTVLDPFSGSGTVPLEASINNRHTLAIDRNPYAVTLTNAKLNPPKSLDEAINSAEYYLDQITPEEGRGVEEIPDWVREFFHPKTLSGIAQLFPILRDNDEYFLIACLLGILHHQRPGFLSYPASHLKPYLRDEKFPRDQYPERYEYRPIQPRLIAKIERAFRRCPSMNQELIRRVWDGDSPAIISNEIPADSVDAIITSPPYMNKLDYGRDNRLRLFFIGVSDYTDLDGSPKSKDEYRDFLDRFLKESIRALNGDGQMVFVLGESRRSGAAVDTSEVLMEMVQKRDELSIEELIQDKVPVREINSMSSKTETILTLSKEVA